ncbi:MAG: hypothetical protein II143_05560 [Bacteroidales bacterium]|nr:hypothetical protein [Bacteroidales bacterium]
MKRILLAIALCAVCATAVCAQDRSPVHFEVGTGFAPLFLMGVEDSFDVPYKADAYVEARYDLGEYFDLGLKADYKYNPIKGENPAVPFSYKGHQHYGGLIATAGLKIPANDRLLFFMGMGFGPGVVKKSITEANMDRAPEGAVSPVGSWNSGCFLVVAPRIGAQIYHHLRLSLSADLTTDAAEDRAETRWPVCLNIGWTF